jgi:DNA-directed RNA polymerase alpha subunit/DNA-directed RNA polymerase subunit L
MATFTNLRRIDSRTIAFTLENITVTYANALRRLMTIGVETVAFNADIDHAGRTGDVVIEANDTPMTNEMLAHRISMIPIHVRDPQRFNPEEYEFRLNVVNDSDRSVDVVAGDFEVWRTTGDAEPVRVNTSEFFPANPKTGDTCLIAVLKSKSFGQAKGERITLRAKASLGTGRRHAAYIPTSQASYAYTPDTDPERRKAVFEAWLSSSKKQTLAALETDEAKRAALEREFNTMQVARCFLKNEKDEPYSFDFTVESAGVLDPVYIVRRACEIAEAMCARYSNLDTGDLPDDVTIQPANAEMFGFDFDFRGHDHTLRIMLSTFLVENHIEGDAEPKIAYASGDVYHPLRDVTMLRIGTDDGQEVTARQALAAAARGCAELYRSLRARWQEVTGAGGGAGPSRRRPVVPAGAGAGAPKITVNKTA